MIQGSVLELDASEPLLFSNAQKNNVAFGWPARFTPTLPAKLRVSGVVALGSSGSVTSKSGGEGQPIVSG
jgi:hypothetical protein